MEKDQTFMGGSGVGTAPPPTAPPSYDEAVANAGAAPRPYPPPDSTPYLPPNTAPYPTAISAPYPTANAAPYPTSNSAPYPTQSMPMPNAYNQPPTVVSMPMPASDPQVQIHQYQPVAQYPQQANMAQQSYAPTTEIHVIQQAVAYALGPHSVKMSCPTCRADIHTSTVSDHQASAHLCCIILCLLGCCLCSCLPYCMNSFLSVHHSCPNCKTYIGTWKG